MEWIKEVIGRLRIERDQLNEAIMVLEGIDGTRESTVVMSAIKSVEIDRTGKPVRKAKEKLPGVKLKKSAKTLYNVSQVHVIAALEAAGEPLSTHSIKEHLLALNMKPSDEHLKKLLALAQNRGAIELGDDGKWHIPESEG